MKWKQFLTPVKNIDADEARSFMNRRPEGSYALLDVRQPKEYEREHLPGSLLIPIGQLADQIDRLDPEKPIIVY